MKKPPVYVEDETLMFKMIRAAFNQRRKTLVNALNNSPEIQADKELIQTVLIQGRTSADRARRGADTGSVCGYCQPAL